MKKFFIFLTLALALGSLCYGAKLPRPQGYVSDFANLIGEKEEQELEKILTSLERATTAQVAVVTFNNLRSRGSIEMLAVELFEDWGPGQKGKDNGVLILMALEERQVRIEVGYGLEGALPDSLCGNIINEIMIPRFKNEKYSQGMLYGTIAVVEAIAAEYNVDLNQISSSAGKISARKDRAVLFDKIIFILAVIFFIFIRFPFSRRVIFWGRSGSFGGSGAFSSGSFGGFGAGGSGGGGASGSW